jgi:hypothetical protein
VTVQFLVCTIFLIATGGQPGSRVMAKQPLRLASLALSSAQWMRRHCSRGSAREGRPWQRSVCLRFNKEVKQASCSAMAESGVRFWLRGEFFLKGLLPVAPPQTLCYEVC